MNNYGESCIMTWPLGTAKRWDIFCENWEPRRRTALKRSAFNSKLFRNSSVCLTIEGLHAKSVYIEFWLIFIFLQDRANFWQTDLF